MMTTKIGSPALTAARARAVWFDLGPAPVIRLVGPDARRFSNGMFTNNVRDLPVGAHNRSAMVDDRGRIGGFLDLCCVDESVFVAVVEGIDAAAFVERYERYVVFDEVTLEPVSGWRRLSVQGPAAGRAIAAPLPGRYSLLEPEGLVYPHVRAPVGGYDVVLPEGAVEAFVAGLAAERITAEEAEGLRVLAGRASFPQDTGDKRLVAELGLRDELLSFDKGCYIGQETVNRVDVMGQVKRALAGIRAPAGEGLGPGAEILHGEEVVGELTSAALLPSGELVGLAVLKRPADDPGTPVTLRAGERSWAGRVEALPFGA